MAEEMEDHGIMFKANFGFLTCTLEYTFPLVPPLGTHIGYRVSITKRTLLRVPVQMPVKPIGGPTRGR